MILIVYMMLLLNAEATGPAALEKSKLCTQVVLKRRIMFDSEYLFDSYVLAHTTMADPIIFMEPGSAINKLWNALYQQVTQHHESRKKYSPLPLSTDFKNEESEGVKRLSKVEREKFKVTVKNGKLVDSNGARVDTRNMKGREGGISHRAILVMDTEGNLFLSSEFQEGKFHHSSLGNEEGVAFAGEISVVNGEVNGISLGSGHYLPMSFEMAQLVHRLEKAGVRLGAVNLEFTNLMRMYGSKFYSPDLLYDSP